MDEKCCNGQKFVEIHLNGWMEENRMKWMNLIYYKIKSATI
jgi:hypothetical protein